MRYLDVEKLNSEIYNDRVWMKYYDYDEKKFIFPTSTIFGYMRDNNLHNLDMYAINYFNTRITYRELFSKIDECLCALVSANVKKGDIVSVCMPTTPESIIAYYAINKLGAVSNFIDVRKSKEEIKEYINEGNSKLLLTLDSIVDKITQIVDTTNLNKVVCISALESINPLIKYPLRIAQSFKMHIPNDSGYSSWHKFLLDGKRINTIIESTYTQNELAILLHTSGSTGHSKTVELPNESVNDRVYQYMNNGMKHNIGDVYMDIIPMFIAFGAVIGVQLPLCMGMEDVLIPAYEQENVAKLLKKYKPNHFTLTPKSYNYLFYSTNYRKIDFSCAQTVASGGDGQGEIENQMYNSKLQQAGCTSNISNGYGGTEIGAPFCTERTGLFKPGSNGIPLPGNNVLIFEHGTLNPLTYNQLGDICMVVDHAMLGYLNNEKLTNKTIIQLSDGKIGILLGDCGYIDEDGFIYIKGRYDDVIQTDNNEEIWPIDVENEIYKLSFIKMCLVSKSENNTCNIFFVPINNEIQANEFMEREIFKKVKKKFPNLEFDIVLCDDLKLTSSGKLDRESVKKYTKKK